MKKIKEFDSKITGMFQYGDYLMISTEKTMYKMDENENITDLKQDKDEKKTPR